MPVLDLPELHLPEASAYVLSVIYFPRDPTSQSRFVEAWRNAATAEILKKHQLTNVPSDLERRVISAATGEKLNFEEFDCDGRISRGISVPSMLLLYTLSTPTGTLSDSVKAITTAGGSRASIPRLSKSNVFKLWAEFVPSVHLAAVLLGWSDIWPVRGGGERALSHALAISEILRARGENHRSSRSGKPLLDPVETWKVPEGITLPKITLVGPTQAELRSWLAEDSDHSK
jgi:hypothetical protein